MILIISNTSADTTDSIQSDDSYRSCDHSGVTYAHGEMYPSTTTGLKRTQQNQCVMCVCLVSFTRHFY